MVLSISFFSPPARLRRLAAAPRVCSSRGTKLAPQVSRGYGTSARDPLSRRGPTGEKDGSAPRKRPREPSVDTQSEEDSGGTPVSEDLYDPEVPIPSEDDLEDEEETPRDLDFSSKYLKRQYPASKWARGKWIDARKVATKSQEAALSGDDSGAKPEIDWATLKYKGDWASTLRQMKGAVRSLTIRPNSAPFKSSKLPDCISFIEDSLSGDKIFKESRERADVAGACGLSLIRCGEIVSASVSDLMENIKADDFDFESFRASMKEKLTKLQNGVNETVELGTRVAAGAFNQEVKVQRNQVLNCRLGRPIKDTLESCDPTSIHLFEDQASKIKEAVLASRIQPSTSFKSNFPRRGSSKFRPSSEKKESYDKSYDKSYNKASRGYNKASRGAPQSGKSGNYRGGSQQRGGGRRQ